MKKKGLVIARNLQIITTVLTLEVSQYRESGSTFSPSDLVVSSNNHPKGSKRIGANFFHFWPARAAGVTENGDWGSGSLYSLCNGQKLYLLSVFWVITWFTCIAVQRRLICQTQRNFAVTWTPRNRKIAIWKFGRPKYVIMGNNRTRCNNDVVMCNNNVIM